MAQTDRRRTAARRVREVIISSKKTLSWAWVEEHTGEGEAIAAARTQAEELGACPVSTGTGQALRMLAASQGARAVLEIGTGAGVGSLWLLSGMAPNGVLTSIDSEAEFQACARRAIRDAGFAPGQARLINGRALDVLPRMAADAYDMVVIDADMRQLDSYISQARRIVRAGGMIVIVHALWDDQVPDPARRDALTVAMRSAVTQLQDDPAMLTSVLTCGDGLAVAVVCEG